MEINKASSKARLGDPRPEMEGNQCIGQKAQFAVLSQGQWAIREGWDGIGMAQDLEAAMPSAVTLKRRPYVDTSCNRNQVYRNQV